jgi:hypothetical protein
MSTISKQKKMSTIPKQKKMTAHVVILPYKVVNVLVFINPMI